MGFMMTMHQTPFDTLKLYVDLRDKAGLPEVQAEGLTEVFSDVVRSYRAANRVSTGPSFDTLKCAIRLRDLGLFSKDQADAAARALADAAQTNPRKSR